MVNWNDNGHSTMVASADMSRVGLTSYGARDPMFLAIERSRPRAISVLDALPLQPEGLFSSAVDLLPTGVLVVGQDGRIVLVNRELERQFGYHRGELLGQPVEMLLPGGLPLASDLEGPEPTTRDGARAQSHGLELCGLRRDGSRCPLEIAVNPIETIHGVLVLASIVDVSRCREIEAAANRTVEGQIAFERLVSDISVQFINQPLDRIDEVIHSALGRVGTALDVDRCHFVRVHADGALTGLQTWEQPGLPALPSPVPRAERFSWALGRALEGEMVCFSNLDEVPHTVDRANFREMGTTAALAVPLSLGGKLAGVIGFNMVRRERSWGPETVHRIHVVATVFSIVLARRQSDEALRRALADLERLRDRPHDENVYRPRKTDEQLGADSTIVGQSPAIRRVLEQIRQVAETDATVLLLGETGTGKELFATRIHQLSARRGRAMVRVNCAAIPSTLIESELFGREKGAFTGALARQAGRFELADHSTIFLDEIGDLPFDVQVKLLRVLEERQIERLGSPKSIQVDTRIIAATHRNLERRIADGNFREDLFYRLNVFPILVPSLRERVEDIPLLVWRFVDEFSKALGKRIDGIPRETMDALQRYPWPGNIRELRNIVERAMIVATGPKLKIAVPSTTAPNRSERLVDVERAHVRSVLEAVGWRIRGTSGAAERLGMKPTTLETRMVKLGLQRPRRP